MNTSSFLLLTILICANVWAIPPKFPQETIKEMTGTFKHIGNSKKCHSEMTSILTKDEDGVSQIELDGLGDVDSRQVFATEHLVSKTELKRCEVVFEDDIDNENIDCARLEGSAGKVIIYQNKATFKKIADGEYQYLGDIIYGDFKSKLNCRYKRI